MQPCQTKEGVGICAQFLNKFRSFQIMLYRDTHIQEEDSCCGRAEYKSSLSNASCFREEKALYSPVPGIGFTTNSDKGFYRC